MENKSYLTAITRKNISVPTRYIMQHGYLNGRILDFGCGKGFDANFLKKLVYDVEAYDPYFAPNMPIGKFDTIICNYVLNVLEKEKQLTCLEEIKSLLNDNGIAYIAVRRDIKNEGYRRRGKHSTYQENVELDFEKITENTKYCIYKFKK